MHAPESVQPVAGVDRADQGTGLRLIGSPRACHGRRGPCERLHRMTVKQSEIDRVLELECDLQTRSTRGDGARLRELLAPDFVEIGASGRQWDLETILGLLSRESSASDSAEIEIVGLSARTLSPDVVQVFWESRRGEQRARRTSLWRRCGGDWQQVYHQGTPLT